MINHISALLLLLAIAPCSPHVQHMRSTSIALITPIQFCPQSGFLGPHRFPPAGCPQYRGANYMPILPVSDQRGCRRGGPPGFLSRHDGNGELAPQTSGLNFRYESEQSGYKSEQAGYDAEHTGHEREAMDTQTLIWRKNQMALSPLQSPVVVVQAVMLFHQKSTAGLSSVCERAIAFDTVQNSSQLQCALDNIAALIEQETAMRQEIRACIQIMFDSSSLKGTGTLAIEQGPTCRQELEQWQNNLLPSGGTSKPTAQRTRPPSANSSARSPSLAQILDTCMLWQQRKHAEEQAVLLPLLAFSCLKNVALRRSTLDMKIRAETQARHTHANEQIHSRISYKVDLCTTCCFFCMCSHGHAARYTHIERISTCTYTHVYCNTHTYMTHTHTHIRRWSHGL